MLEIRGLVLRVEGRIRVLGFRGSVPRVEGLGA